MAKRQFTTRIRMGAGAFDILSTDGRETVRLDLATAGQRKGVDVVRRGSLMQDLSSAAEAVCKLHGIKDKPLRGAKGKFLKRGRPWAKRERPVQHEARA